MAGEPTNKIYMEQGGDAMAIKAADGAVIKGQSTAGAAPSQAAAIDDITVTGTYATDDTPIETAINSILAVLRNTGQIASS